MNPLDELTVEDAENMNKEGFEFVLEDGRIAGIWIPKFGEVK